MNVACTGEIRPRQKWEILEQLYVRKWNGFNWHRVVNICGLLGVLKLLTSTRAQEFLDHRVELNWLATLLHCTLMLQPDTLNCFCNISVLKIAF